MMRPFIGACGRNFQLGCGVRLLNTDKLHIGNDVYIAYGCWVNALGGVSIGSEVVFGPYVVISSLQHVFANGSVRFGGSKLVPVKIGDGTWVAAHSSIRGGTTVGSGALVAANAMVVKDVPANVVVGGVPAKVLGPNRDDTADFYTRQDLE